jgi:hypothetical protein
MADIARRGDLDVRVVNPTTQTGLAVTSNGDNPTDILRVGGASLSLGQKAMSASIPMVLASDQSAVPVVNSITGKTRVMQTGVLVSVATTANQVILTYTVTAAKSFILAYLAINAYRTTLPGNTNPIFLGNVSLESPAATKLFTWPMFHAPNNGGLVLPTDEDLWFPASTVIRVVVTPAAATSTTWRANFGGYEI